MRAIILLVSLVLVSTLSYSQNWQVGSQGFPIKEKIYSQSAAITSVDSTTYIFATQTTSDSLTLSYIIKTTDFGITWDTLHIEHIGEKPKPSFIDVVSNGDTILALYSQPLMLKSVDGGENWQEITWQGESYWPETQSLKYENNILYMNKRCQFKTTTPDTLMYSYDFGETWEYAEVGGEDTTGEYVSEKSIGLTYVDGDNIIVNKRYGVITYNYGHEAEGNAQFLKSTDAGKTWNEFAFLKYNEIEDYEIGQDGNIYTMAAYRYKKDSTAIGNTKIYIAGFYANYLRINPGTSKIDTLASFIEPNLGKCEDIILFGDKVVARFGSKIYVSQDGGYTWVSEKYPYGLSSFRFTIASMARPVFGAGMISGFTSYECWFGRMYYPVSVQDSRYFVDNISLYPNPATSAGTINLEFDAKESGMYSYKISTIDGRSFSIGSESFLSEGMNTIDLQLGSNLSSGAYFLSILRDGEAVAVKKVIVE